MSKKSYEKLDELKEKDSVSGAQHFLCMKDSKLLLSGSQNFVLPVSGNDELCAKLQTLMLENLFEETEKE